MADSVAHSASRFTATREDLAVEIHALTHRYDLQTALEDVSFDVPAGSLFGLLGPNGSGKTTLFRILSTLLVPSSGTARILGIDVVGAPTRVRKKIGFVFQQPALDDELTILENLRFHGALYGLHGKALRERIDQLALALGIEERLRDRVKVLSGGLQRRADLVRGLLHRPPILLLDEPTNGLDPAARYAFWQAMGHLRREEGTTLLLATHLMEEAERCDTVGIMNKGNLAAVGTPTRLKNALSSETLWLETHAPEELKDRIQAQFGFSTQIVGNTVQISHPEAHSILGSLYDAFGEHIESATIRKPTLEDVFMVFTGNRLGEPDPVLK